METDESEVMRDSIVRYLIVTMFTLSGCAVGPDYSEPETPQFSSFVEADEAGASLAEPSRLWWQGFEDPLLSSLITEAMAENKTIDAALARLRDARAFWRDSTLGLLPTITGTAGYEDSKFSQDRTPGAPPEALEVQLYDAGFDAIWELDFWGRIRREIESRKALERSADASVEDARQSVVAELVRAYIELRTLQEKLRIVEENIKVQTSSLELSQVKYQAGSVSELDVVQAESLLEQTRAELPSLQAQTRIRLYQLAVLLGRTPEQIDPVLSERRNIPSYRDELALGDPTMLLRRRPDIRIAERNLASAVAKIGFETADLFPRVELFGSLSVEARDFDDLFGDGATVYSVGPRITWAAFNLRRVLTDIEQSRALADERFALYEQAVLEALQEVESSLVQFGKERERRAVLLNAVRSSRRAVELAELQYRNGSVDYLTVLAATRDVLSVELSLADSEALCITALVSVFKALGANVTEPEAA